MAIRNQLRPDHAAADHDRSRLRQVGAFGYGECTAPEDPFYNHETIDTAWIIFTNYVGACSPKGASNAPVK